MRAPLLLALALSTLVTSRPARAAGFRATPASVWAIKEGPKGAVVREDCIRFTGTTVNHLRPIRIFAEGGVAAVDCQDLPCLAIGVVGRTAYPDGREVWFNNLKDFVPRVVETQGIQQSQLHCVAPGVASDCVVEFQWSEPADGPRGDLPRRIGDGHNAIWNLANAFPAQLRTVEEWTSFRSILAWIEDVCRRQVTLSKEA